MIKGNMPELIERYNVSDTTIRRFIERLQLKKTLHPLSDQIYYYEISDEQDKLIKEYIKSPQFKLARKTAQKALRAKEKKKGKK